MCVVCLHTYKYIYIHIYEHCMNIWDLLRPEEGVESVGTGITDSCEPSCGCWGLNTGSLQEQQVP